MTQRHAVDREAGFTLIELLIVLVIIPIIIGAMAEALIVSLNHEADTSNRISDTLSAQLTQDYFVRDVQGASYITTVDNSGAGPYLATSPQVCSPGSGSLLVALYHPAEGSGPALDVAYWQEGLGPATEIDRYTCTLSATYTTASRQMMVIANSPPPTVLGPGATQEAISATTVIGPTQIASSAGAGWTQVASYTEAEGYVNPTLSVASTAGFTNGTITVGTTEGLQSVACTVASSAAFSCSALTGVTNGDPVTQASVSSVQISIIAPASSYKYSLLAAPRTSSQQQASGQSSPTLLTLGPNGIQPVHGGGTASCPDGTRANICIGTSESGVVVDNGGVNCSGGGAHNFIWFQSGGGAVDTVSPSASSSCANVSITGSVLPVPDPLQGKLPNDGCFASNLVSAAAGGSATSKGLPLNPSTNGSGYAVPGVYTNATLSGTLEPGVYVVEDGVGSVSIAPQNKNDPYYQLPYNSGTTNYDPTSGVLLFVPVLTPGPYSSEQACFVDPGSVAKGGTISVAPVSGTVTGLVPVDTAQSASFFGGDVALGGVWLWQDANNANNIFFNGYTQPAPGSSGNGGMMYAPSAEFDPGGGSPTSFSTGPMIIGGINDNGTHLSLCLDWTYTSSC